jgi:nicotinamide riboside kinase
MKLAKNDPLWRTEEFSRIAEEQTRREDAASRQANRVLLCDTNAFATVLWHRRYMGGHSQATEEIARRGKCDLYLLTGDEIPFVQDGLRDGEHIRHEMHGWFEHALAKQSVPWQIVCGSHETRMRVTIGKIRELFQNSHWWPGTPGL